MLLLIEIDAVISWLGESLLSYAREHPEDARGIEKVLGFRKRVQGEFDRLVREREAAAINR